MRVPHTVSINSLQAYEASEATLGLVGERGRYLRAENWAWDDDTPPTLAEECIRFFVADFDEHKRVLPLLHETNAILLLETLSISLPLNIVIPLIPDGIYWKRRCNDTWSNMNDVTRYGDSWKRMFTERYVKDLVESEEPGYTDWTELGNCLKLCCPFVKRLEISQLQPPRSMGIMSEGLSLSGTEDVIPEHLDLGPVLTILENLQDLDLQFGIKNIGMKYTFNCFRINIKDIERLGNGIKLAHNLRILRISCSDIDEKKLKIILKNLENCELFEELDISHCKIGNIGAKALGRFICVKSSLKHLKLQNNLIKDEGAQGLAYSLTDGGRAELVTLDLKFNLIGEEGGRSLSSALAKSHFPQNLVISGCGLGEIAGADLVQMLGVNRSLTTLDLTNNALGLQVGEMMVKALQNNKCILRLDVRNCGFSEESKSSIHQLTLRNREQLRKMKVSNLSLQEYKRRDTSLS